MGSLSGLALECGTGGMTGATCASRSCPGPENSTFRLHRLKDFLDSLEEERKKIEAFRRELPLCMQLLHDAIESCKEKLAVYTASVREWPLGQMDVPVNESHSSLPSTGYRSAVNKSSLPKKVPELPFTPSPKDDLVHRSTSNPDWIAMPVCPSFQGESHSHSQETDLAERVSRHLNHDQAFSASSKPFFHSRTKSGGAFTPFSRDKQVVQPVARTGSLNPADLVACHKDHDVSPQSGVSNTLPDPGKGKPQGIMQKHCNDLHAKRTVEIVNGESDDQPVRKARRCWSPELHRRFVNSLEQLGGSQVATPKQIRELMKVDGLTNDEVKSHLQKYRLHTKRPNLAHNTHAQSPQVVVLGGIWVPPDYTVNAAAQQAAGLYNTTRQPLPCQAVLSQELYSEMGSVDQAHFPLPGFNFEKLAPVRSSQSSLHGSSELAGRSSRAANGLADTAGDEGVCDDEGSNNSSYKGGRWVFQADEMDEMSEREDDRSQGDSISGFQSPCTSEGEGSGGGDTRLKMK